MNFTETLYKQISIAFPSTTVRSFSRDCGMSEGYWGSIQAQQRPISTKALDNLVNTMDMKAKNNGNNHHIQNIKQMIADEIAIRQTTANISSNSDLRQMILDSVNTMNHNDKDPTDSLVKLMVLEEEVEHYKTMLMPHDTGHIHTTINFLEARIRDLQEIVLERKNNQL